MAGVFFFFSLGIYCPTHFILCSLNIFKTLKNVFIETENFGKLREMTTNIKDVIANLCKLVNLLCFTNLKPEHFRLAKFDKDNDNVIASLWDALSKFLQINMNNLEDLKKQMQSLEYSRKEFFNPTKPEEYRSREILLALGYTIAKKLDTFIQLAVKESPFSENYLLKLHKETCGTPSNLKMSSLSARDTENYRMWLKGKVLLNRRATEDYLEQITRIQLKLNKQFDLKVTGSLTLYELLALKSSKFEEQFLQDSKEILQILSIYTEWVKTEKHFWKWMGTVLDERHKAGE